MKSSTLRSASSIANAGLADERVRNASLVTKVIGLTACPHQQRPQDASNNGARRNPRPTLAAADRSSQGSATGIGIQAIADRTDAVCPTGLAPPHALDSAPPPASGRSRQRCGLAVQQPDWLRGWPRRNGTSPRSRSGPGNAPSAAQRPERSPSCTARSGDSAPTPTTRPPARSSPATT